MEEEGVSDEDVLKRLLEERAASGAVDKQEELESETPGPKVKDQAHEDAIFMQSYIPRTLNEVYDPERDVEKHRRGDNLIYADTIGLVTSSDKDSSTSAKSSEDLAKTQKSGHGDLENVPEGDEDRSEGDDETEDDNEDGEKDGFKEKKPRGHRHEDKDEKKVTFCHFYVRVS